MMSVLGQIAGRQRRFSWLSDALAKLQHRSALLQQRIIHGGNLFKKLRDHLLKALWL